MHLAQHHFQAQNRYFESSIQFAISHLFFKPYGVAGFELDSEALMNGTVSLLHARGVMPDGLAFHFPDGDPVPAARHIRDLFLPTQDSHLLLLTIPPFRADHVNCAIDPGDRDGPARYVAETSLLFDETTGRDEKPVDLGRKNFRLMLDTELEEDLISLPLARICRDGTGHFMYDPEYIPPCLQIGASPHLMELLRRLVEKLETKSEAMAKERREEHSSVAEYAAHDVAGFWLSHTIHASLATLRHHLSVRRSRPDELYAELARLAGGLCTFSLDAHPRNIPLYDHEHLEECFSALERHIRSHLEIIIPKNRVSIPLRQERSFLHVGEVTDARCFGPSQWVLGVRSSSASEEELVAEVPKQVKVCSGKYIVRIVKEERDGLPLEHLAFAPPSVVPRIGSHYFLMKKTGPCWKAIEDGGDVGIYVPEDLPDVELEFIVVLEGEDSDSD